MGTWCLIFLFYSSLLIYAQQPCIAVFSDNNICLVNSTCKSFKCGHLVLHLKGEVNDSTLNLPALTKFGNVKISPLHAVIGSAIVFNGTGDYIEIASSSDFDFLGNDYTIEFWFRTISIGSFQTLISRSGNETENFAFHLDITNIGEIMYQSGNGAQITIKSSTKVSANVWYHVAVTCSSGTTRLFLNGIAESSTNIPTSISSSEPVRIGYGRRNDTYLNGYIDDLRFTKGVARYISSFIPAIIAYPSSPLWTPHQLGNTLKMWADIPDTTSIIFSNFGTVEQVNDKSGNGAHLFMSNSSHQPAFSSSGLNGGPALIWDGVNDVMTASIPGLNSFTHLGVYAVFQTRASTADGSNLFLFCFGNLLNGPSAYPVTTSIHLQSNTVYFTGETIYIAFEKPNSRGRLGSSNYSREANTTQILQAEFTSDGTRMYVNDVGSAFNLFRILSSNSSTAPANLGYTVDNDLHVGGYRLGNSLIGGPPMILSEMLVVNQTQTTETRQKIAGYFAHKYWRERHLPVPLASNHPYFSFPPYL